MVSENLYEESFFPNLIKKEVPFQCMGISFRFALSQSLFSSHNIDSGTQILLKSLFKRVNPEEIKSILDIGCGVGTLGICMGKICKNAQIIVEDRNQLAVEFSLYNAKQNGIETKRFTGRCQLAFEKPGDLPQDLILCNIPAKAGLAVIREMIIVSSKSLSNIGQAAMVIVSPLAKDAKKILNEYKINPLYLEENKDYTVFHFSKTGAKEALNPLIIKQEHYIRGTFQFNIMEMGYKLSTAFNISDFDQLNPSFKQIGELVDQQMLKWKNIKQAITITTINPGQGHIPRLIQILANKHNLQVNQICQSRDQLELLTTKLNLLNDSNHYCYQKFPFYKKGNFETNHQGQPSLQLIIFIPSKQIPSSELPIHAQCFDNRVEKETLLIIAGKSSEITQLQNHLKKFSLIRNKKSRGYRALIFKKKC